MRAVTTSTSTARSMSTSAWTISGYFADAAGPDDGVRRWSFGDGVSDLLLEGALQYLEHGVWVGRRPRELGAVRIALSWVAGPSRGSVQTALRTVREQVLVVRDSADRSRRSAPMRTGRISCSLTCRSANSSGCSISAPRRRCAIAKPPTAAAPGQANSQRGQSDRHTHRPSDRWPGTSTGCGASSRTSRRPRRCGHAPAGSARRALCLDPGAARHRAAARRLAA